MILGCFKDKGLSKTAHIDFIQRGWPAARSFPRLAAMLCLVWPISIQPLFAQNVAPGSIDPSFTNWTNRRVARFILTQSNDLFVAGSFTIPGAGTNWLRLRPDGAHNPTFAPTYFGITALALQPDGKLLGGFRGERDVSRFLPDGSLDSTFNFVPPEVHPRILSFWTTALAVQPDGRILVAGYRLVSGNDDHMETRWAYREVYRLFPDGSVDTAFGPQWQAVRAIAVLPGDRILLAGNSLILLHPDGTTDTNFVRGPFLPDRSESLTAETTTLPTAIACLAIQPDFRILVGGSFTNVQGHPRSRVARVLPDGRLDLSFNPPPFTGADSPEPQVEALALQQDGRILIGGVLRSEQWTGVRSIVRLNPDGSLDATFAHMTELFDDDEEPLGSVHSILIQDQTRAVIGGEALDAGALFRIHLVGDPPPLCEGFCIISFTVQPNSVTITWRSQPGQTYYIESKASLADPNWTIVSGGIIAQGTQASWTGLRPPGASAFYRVAQLDP